MTTLLTTIDSDRPLRLVDAAAARGLTVSTLRTEAKRGRLVIWRVAGKDWTSLAEIDRMFERCRVTPQEPDFGLDQREKMKTAISASPSGSSRTESDKLALDAVMATMLKLKNSSRRTSPKNTSQNVVSGRFQKSASSTS